MKRTYIGTIVLVGENYLKVKYQMEKAKFTVISRVFYDNKEKVYITVGPNALGRLIEFDDIQGKVRRFIAR